LVCASDSLALGALRATAGRTASVGDLPSTGRAVAVIGFDDTPVAQAIGLTSVGQPLAEAASKCVELLARLLDHGGTGQPEHVLIRPHVVVRDSG
jgi:DNA-binding LacI/PurR family transcriptional regulator